MKKLLFTLSLLLLPLLASADPVEIDGIYYNLIEKAGQAEVTENPNKYTGNVEIPESVNYKGKKYSVTSIGNSAFFRCSDLTSLTIPNSVTSIGSEAFSNCSSLTSVTIPNSVISVGNFAFEYCFSLTSVTIPNSVTSIGACSFWGCINLTSVTFPNSVTSIGHHAFSGCISLTSVSIPNSVKYIGVNAFNGCSSLTSITIPNSVTSIGLGAFEGCRSLTSVTIPNSLTTIDGSLFRDCKGLTSVTIPNSVTSIGVSAFQGCSGLTTVTIPNNVTSIGGDAFRDCCSLVSITIPTNVSHIEHAVFYGCSSLTSLLIPQSVTSIASYAFANCSSLTSLAIPSDVTYIDGYAFSGCSGLKLLKIGSGVKEINYFAFAECKELNDIHCLAEDVPITDTSVFMNSPISQTTLHIPAKSLTAYKITDPWSRFGKIVSLDGGGTGSEMEKCSTPTISYLFGQLSFSCDTEDVTFVSEITDYDIKKSYDASLYLTATYYISVYATKEGYEDSEVATATLSWMDAELETDISGGAANVRAKPVLIQSNGNTLSISGVDEGTPISIYDVSGKMVGSAKAASESTFISTSLNPGDVGLVKIGDKTIKIIVK